MANSKEFGFIGVSSSRRSTMDPPMSPRSSEYQRQDPTLLGVVERQCQFYIRYLFRVPLPLRGARIPYFDVVWFRGTALCGSKRICYAVSIM